MKDIIKVQRSFYATGTSRSVDYRIEQLRKLEQLLIDNEEVLYEAIYKDFKKSKFDVYTTEISMIHHDINLFCKKMKSWAKPQSVGTGLLEFPAKSYTVPHPLGTTLVIGAWNYPFQLSLMPMIAAMAAGNTVVVKPSELAPHSAAAMEKIINENFDPGYLKVVCGGIPETTALLDEKFDKIFFTGSTQVGKIVYQAAAKNLTPVTLELGGKSPAIFTEDCNLEMSVKRLIWAKFVNAGQSCIAPDYLLVPTTMKGKVLNQIKEEIEKSNYAVENNNFPLIINERNTQRLIDMIDPGKVHHGGKYDLKERTVEPTVLHNVTLEDKVMQSEIFGPILPVLTYNTLEEAISIVNTMPNPLSCYLFTGSNKIKNTVINNIQFGGGGINDCMVHVVNNNYGFGGVGDSGIGSYHGKVGFDSFSHYKSIMDKPTWMESDLKYYDHEEKDLKNIKMAMKLVNRIKT